MVITKDAEVLFFGKDLQIFEILSCKKLDGKSVQARRKIALCERVASLICPLPFLTRRNKGNLDATT